MSKILLHVRNVKKQYKDAQGIVREALKGVTFDLMQGEVFGLLGVNGAGKTTLSSLIATLHPPTEGDIVFDGVSIYKNLERYRSQLGFCPQKPNLNNMLSLEDNLRFAGRFYGMTEKAIDQRLNILVDRFDLRKYLPQKASVLSGGYKQRFMIARSLIHSPKILLLDEPTVGLDPHVRRQLWTFIKDFKNEGITVILTTHYLDEAEQLSDRVCILDQGVIKLIDTPDKLMADFKQKNLEDVFIQLMKNDSESEG